MGDSVVQANLSVGRLSVAGRAFGPPAGISCGSQGSQAACGRLGYCCERWSAGWGRASGAREGAGAKIMWCHTTCGCTIKNFGCPPKDSRRNGSARTHLTPAGSERGSTAARGCAHPSAFCGFRRDAAGRVGASHGAPGHAGFGFALVPGYRVSCVTL